MTKALVEIVGLLLEGIQQPDRDAVPEVDDLGINGRTCSPILEPSRARAPDTQLMFTSALPAACRIIGKWRFARPQLGAQSGVARWRLEAVKR